MAGHFEAGGGVTGGGVTGGGGRIIGVGSRGFTVIE